MKQPKNKNLKRLTKELVSARSEVLSSMGKYFAVSQLSPIFNVLIMVLGVTFYIAVSEVLISVIIASLLFPLGYLLAQLIH